VTVTDLDGDTDSSSVAVDVVSDDLPSGLVVSATPETGGAPLMVVFSCEMEGGNPPATYSWEFGDGETSRSASPIHTYTAPGLYSATCTGVDADGDVAESTIDIDVQPENAKPNVVAEIIAGDCAVPGYTRVELDASATTDPEDDALSYEWVFISVPRGSTTDFNNPNVANPVFLPDVAGTYQVRAFVSDGYNRAGSDVLEIVASDRAGEMTILSSDTFTGAARTEAQEPLEVHVDNECGIPLLGADITWIADNVTVEQSVTTTNSLGTTTNYAWFGGRVGSGTVDARLGTMAATFSFEITAGEATYLVMEYIGSATVDEAMPLVLQVTDADLNPLTTPDVDFTLTMDASTIFTASGLNTDRKSVV